jgi:hypothetical protein
MVHPVGVAYLFAAVVLAVVLYSVGRLFVARYLRRHNHDDVSIAHVLMGIAMIGMLIPRWNVISSGVGEVLFAAVAIYFAVVAARVRGGRTPWGGDDRFHPTYHPLVHLLMACAMLYMYWLGMPITGPLGSTTAMGTFSTRAGGPALTFLLIVLLVVAAVWLVDSITSYAPSRRLVLTGVGAGGEQEEVAPSADSSRPWLAPRSEISCHAAMCIAMAYLLVLMV